MLRKIISFISNWFSKSTKQDLTHVEYYKLGRNSRCYCNSGEKYKHCHLVENNRKGKHAFVHVINGGMQNIKLLNDQQALNIKVRNTFSEADIGSASL